MGVKRGRRFVGSWFACGCRGKQVDQSSKLKGSMANPSFETTLKEEAHIPEYAQSEHFISEASFYSAIDPSSGYAHFVPGRLAHGGSRRLGSGVPFDPSLMQRPSWTTVNSDRFFVRVGPNYPKLGLKEASASSLYEPVGVDILRNDFRIVGRVACHQQFPTVPVYYPSGFCPLPALIVINAQLPLQAPSLFGHSKVDPGISVAVYFVIKETTVKWAMEKGEDAPAAVRQLKRLIDRGYSDKHLALKTITHVRDWDAHKIPMSSLLKKYNGKPGTITASGTFIRDKIPYDYLEVDFDVRKWNILARSAFPNLKDKLRELTLDVAFVVEATADADLPERVLGCLTVHGIDWAEAEDFDVSATPPLHSST